MSDTYELEKWAEVAESASVIEDFLDWCGEQGWSLHVYPDDRSVPRPVIESRERIIYRFFNVNIPRLEEQRRALLESIRPKSPAAHAEKE